MTTSDKYEYAIRTSTTDGTEVYIPLAFGADHLGKKLADQYVTLPPGSRPRTTADIDWRVFEVIRRPVGEWEPHPNPKEVD